MAEEYGYPLELFVHAVDQNYVCPICVAVLRDPVVCKDGHTLCAKCLNRAMVSGNRTCPVDRSYLGIREPSRNLVLNAMIQKLTIKCPNSFETGGIGCDWMGPLETVENHSIECGMKMVQCANRDCSVKVYQYELTVHGEKCPHRWTKCGQCLGDYKVVFKDKHTTSCPKIVVECPNNCGEQILRDQVIAHFQNCKEEPFACPLSCGQILQSLNQEALTKHFQTNTTKHLDETLSLLMRMREGKGNERAPETVDRAMFVWETNRDDIFNNSSTIVSPVISNRLTSFKCGIRRHDQLIDVFITAKSKMEITSVLTSGMVMMKTNSNQEVCKGWTCQVLETVNAICVKNFVKDGDLPEKLFISFHVKILM